MFFSSNLARIMSVFPDFCVWSYFPGSGCPLELACISSAETTLKVEVVAARGTSDTALLLRARHFVFVLEMSQRKFIFDPFQLPKDQAIMDQCAVCFSWPATQSQKGWICLLHFCGDCFMRKDHY